MFARVSKLRNIDFIDFFGIDRKKNVTSKTAVFEIKTRHNSGSATAAN